jgi:quercetin dioxygenase-like cupin family protein
MMAEHRKETKPQQTTTKTEGAIKAGSGRYTFDLAHLNAIDAGPGYSTAHGPVIEGERIQIGMIRMPKGTGARPHTHPNEQWIYVIQGTLDCEVDGVKSRVPPGSLIYIPANTVHWVLAIPDLDQDVIFLTAKDMTHGIVGTAVDTSVSTPLYAPGFEPKT